MYKSPVPVNLGVRLTKLDESRLLLAAALVGYSKSEMARQAINVGVNQVLLKAAETQSMAEEDATDRVAAATAAGVSVPSIPEKTAS